MWFLSFLPSWYVHIIPLSALAIIFASMVLKVIPFVSTYYIPIRIIGFVLLLFGVSLISCTITRQFPLFFISKEFFFKRQEKSFFELSFSTKIQSIYYFQELFSIF